MNQLRLMMIMILMGFSACRLYKTSYEVHQLRRSKGWIFIDRMRFGEGKAQVSFTTKINMKDSSIQKNYKIKLGIVPDSIWTEEAQLKCQRKLDPNAQNQKKQIIITNTMNRANSLVQTQFLEFNVSKQQTYHFILKDCSRQLVNQYFSSNIYLEIQLKLLNNQSQKGEQQQFNGLILSALIIFTILMIYTSKQFRQQIDNSIDWWKVLLHIALWINLFALCFKLLNHLIYAYVNGVQFGVFDFLYLTLHSISESIITSLLLFVSYGWTITFINSNDFDLYIPLLSMLGIINVILTLLNKINDSDHDKYHMYDSIPAYILAFFRFITVLIFVVGIIISVYSAKMAKIKQFYGKFLILGLLYFLSLPLLMIFSYMFSQSMRAEFVFLGVELIKNGVNMILTYMVTSKKSHYKDVKFLNQSFMEVDGKKYL